MYLIAKSQPISHLAMVLLIYKSVVLKRSRSRNGNLQTIDSLICEIDEKLYSAKPRGMHLRNFAGRVGIQLMALRRIKFE